MTPRTQGRASRRDNTKSPTPTALPAQPRTFTACPPLLPFPPIPAGNLPQPNPALPTPSSHSERRISAPPGQGQCSTPQPPFPTTMTTTLRLRLLNPTTPPQFPRRKSSSRGQRGSQRHGTQPPAWSAAPRSETRSTKPSTPTPSLRTMMKMISTTGLISDPHRPIPTRLVPTPHAPRPRHQRGIPPPFQG